MTPVNGELEGPVGRGNGGRQGAGDGVRREVQLQRALLAHQLLVVPAGRGYLVLPIHGQGGEATLQGTRQLQRHGAVGVAERYRAGRVP